MKHVQKIRIFDFSILLKKKLHVIECTYVTYLSMYPCSHSMQCYYISPWCPVLIFMECLRHGTSFFVPSSSNLLHSL